MASKLLMMFSTGIADSFEIKKDTIPEIKTAIPIPGRFASPWKKYIYPPNEAATNIIVTIAAFNRILFIIALLWIFLTM